MHYDLVIRAGTVVTEEASYKADLGIVHGQIAAIAQDLGIQGREVIDASDKLVLPGAVDVHTHLDMPVGQATTSDDFLSGTKAAACGGTTTIVDYCIQEKGQSLQQAAAAWHKKATGKAFIDYGFHIAITDASPAVLDEIPAMKAAGYPSLKLFLTYEDARVSDAALLDVLQATAACGGLVCVHAENHDIIGHYTRQLLTAGKTAPRYHECSRPVIAEAEATARAIYLAKLAEAPLYIVHLSCRDALEEVQRARRQGFPVMAETCPQYLLLDRSYYHLPGFEGAKYVMSPPLRAAEHQEPLWKALAGGVLQTAATDHCSFGYKGQKEAGLHSFDHIPNGAPGVETRLMLLHTYGVVHGRLNLQQLVKITAGNPARIFGLYPQKGTVQVGSDADLVVFDPKAKAAVEWDTLHEAVDYTPFEGFALQGVVEKTLVRGRILYDRGRFADSDPPGRFIQRQEPMWV